MVLMANLARGSLIGSYEGIVVQRKSTNAEDVLQKKP